MKRIGSLFTQVIERENFRLAFYKASISKRNRREVQEFGRRLDFNLSMLQQKLSDGSFDFGKFTQFVIHDPKERTISAPRFQERVVHHAIMNVCEPWLDRWLIDDTFACRRGLGRDAALQRALKFAGRGACFLKLDIRKYFESISRDELLIRLAKRFKDRDLLKVFAKIIHSFKPQQTTGVPIGSLTSQHFANFYLGWFDRFVKDELRVQGYVRYMDDMVLWGNTTQAMSALHKRAVEFLRDPLRLVAKPTTPQHSRNGMNFLGCRVFPGYLTLNRTSKIRFRRKLRRYERLSNQGSLSDRELQRRVDAALAFVRSAGILSRRFRQAALKTAEESVRRRY